MNLNFVVWLYSLITSINKTGNYTQTNNEFLNTYIYICVSILYTHFVVLT